MKKSAALILALSLTLLIYGNFLFFNVATSKKLETALVTRAIDGDTLVLSGERIVRLVNINSPEKSRPGYTEAKEFMQNLENRTVEIEITGTDKYKRTLVRVYLSGVYMNLESVRNGLSTKFLVDESELSLFAEGENQAIEQGIGIWKKSEFSNCFLTQVDTKNEVISIKNACEPVNVKGWIARDESRKEYKFGDVSLGETKLRTANGRDNKTDLFWNSKQNVWNNDRDTLYLFDSEWRLVNYESYGY